MGRVSSGRRAWGRPRDQLRWSGELHLRFLPSTLSPTHFTASANDPGLLQRVSPRLTVSLLANVPRVKLCRKLHKACFDRTEVLVRTGEAACLAPNHSQRLRLVSR